MLIYAALNLCIVEIQPNSSDLQNRYRDDKRTCRWKLTDTDLQPKFLRPVFGQILLHSCDTVKTQNVLPINSSKKFFTVTFVNISDRNEVVLYRLWPPLGAAECSLTACV